MNWLARLMGQKRTRPALPAVAVPRRIGEFLKIQALGPIILNDEMERSLGAYLSDEITRRDFQLEVAEAFSDPNTDWIGILTHFDVYEAEDAADAHDYAKLAIWDYAFPGEPLPLERR